MYTLSDINSRMGECFDGRISCAAARASTLQAVSHTDRWFLGGMDRLDIGRNGLVHLCAGAESGADRVAAQVRHGRLPRPRRVGRLDSICAFLGSLGPVLPM